MAAGRDDIRLAWGFTRHAKTHRLIRAIGYEGPFRLVALWSYAAENHPDGRLPSPDDVEIGAGWTGAPGALVAALKATGFLEADGRTLHDWEHEQPWVARRGERVAQARSAGAEGGRKSAESRKIRFGSAQPKGPGSDRSAPEAVASETSKRSRSGRFENPEAAPNLLSSPLRSEDCVLSEHLSSRDETTGGDSPDSSADADLPPLALAWNAAVEHAGLPRVTRLSAARRRHVVARLKDEPDLAVWSRAFALIAADPFCRGTNDRGWRANFDYALRPEKCGRWLDLARAGPTEATPTADDEPWAVRTQRERLARLRQHVAAGTALTPRDAATLAELEAWERAHPVPRSAAGGSR